MEASLSPQLRKPPPNSNSLAVTRLTHMMSGRVLLLALLYLIPIQFLNLLTAVTTVYSASAIHAGARPLGLQDMLHNSIAKTRWKGPLVTLRLYVPLVQYFLDGHSVFHPIGSPTGVKECALASCFYDGCDDSPWNLVIKWVVFMVYYHDCKWRCREKVDMEEVQGIYTEDMPVALRELNDNYPEAMIVQQQQNQLLGPFPPSFLKMKDCSHREKTFICFQDPQSTEVKGLEMSYTILCMIRRWTSWMHSKKL
ncbi:hypothetical protein CK203_070123 [Vitis vinifera]|uniref:Uncharacterized protein n=1 Tax=Vitis vinifera TaxID=29760 RepID=A0A438EHT0_VITVI|nr:hypothetical protein CK203_070123 [Vitis vinifera]